MSNNCESKDKKDEENITTEQKEKFKQNSIILEEEDNLEQETSEK
jgi:hypothetical protein